MEHKHFKIGDEVEVIKSKDKTKLGRKGIVVNAGYLCCAVRYDLPNEKVECIWESYDSLELVKHDAARVYAKEYLAAEKERRNIEDEEIAEFCARVNGANVLPKQYLSSEATSIYDCPSKSDEERFRSILDTMFDTFKAKNHDYGNSFAKTFKEFGIMAPVVRMNDKMERIKQLIKSDAQVKDESIRDTILDLANYCVLTLVELDK